MKKLMIGLTAAAFAAGCTSNPEATAKTMDVLGSVAGAVLAHKGYTVFIVYLKGNIPEKGGAAEFNGQSIYCDHICLLCLL